MNKNVIVMLSGFYLDMLFGDPPNIVHPICAIGNIISKTEHILRNHFDKTEKEEKKAGIFLVTIVLTITLAITTLLLFLMKILSKWAAFLTEIILCWYMIAMKSLKKESMAVYTELKKGNLKNARKAVSRIVGRDTQNLTQQGVIKAAVETVAENTSDGVVAPLFYMTFFGALGGVFYKTINTMDSMIAYKNEKYIHFGKCAALLDDIVNYIPARLSAIFMCCAATLLKYDGKNSFKIWLRDRRKHASPNSAQTEAACAGALGIQLAGDAWYFGKKYKKPFIGDKKKNVEIEDIKRANKLLYATSTIAITVFSIVAVLLGSKWKKGRKI